MLYASSMTTTPFQRLTNKNAALWGCGTAAVVLAYSGFLAVTQPANRWYALFGPFVVALVAAIVLRDKSYIEEAAVDTYLVHRQLLGTKRVIISSADSIAIVANNAGGLLLAVRSAKQTAYAMLYMKTAYHPDGIAQPQQVLDVLAHVLQASSAAGAGEVRIVIEGQRVHAQAGSSLNDSPLGKLADNKHDKLANGAALAVLVGHL